MVNDILREAAQMLAASSTPLLDARVLLAYAMGYERAELIFRPATESEKAVFFNYVKKRREGVPIAYITHSKEFMGHSFYVDENTLIPRPDTECLVERVISEKSQAVSILDLCTGCGCIGISLALSYPSSEAVLIDISDGALSAADKNIKKYSLESRVRTVRQDVLSEKAEGRYDIITANPPYIPTACLLELEVSKHEPLSALDGGEDGLMFYRAIMNNAKLSLNEGGILVFEIGYDQRRQIKEIAESFSFRADIYKDYGG